MNLVENQVGNVILRKARGKLDNQVCDYIHKQLWIQIMDHVGYEVYIQVRTQISNHIKRNI
jgi:hypothetical protein